MTPEHIVRDLSEKLGEDLRSAVLRSTNLVSDFGARAAICMYGMQDLAVLNAMLVSGALGRRDLPTPNRAEMLASLLMVARGANEGGTVRSLAITCQRDASLLIANGFPIAPVPAGEHTR